VITIQKASKVYSLGGEEIRALDNLSLKIDKGDFVALLGSSGSGKSTLLNVVGSLDTLTSGRVVVEGVDISKKKDKEQARYRRTRVGFIFQTFNLQRRLTATENVELPLLFDNIPAQKRKAMALEALSKVNLSDRVGHRPSELSGGQQQRVAIARAMVNNPKVLLADEPTGNLDSKSGENIMKLIRNLNKKENMTVIVVTHNEEHALYADRVLRIRDGKILRDSKKKQ